VAAPEFKHADLKLRLEATKDYFDTILKGAGLLLVGHGAAILASLTYYKEQAAAALGGRLPLLAFLLGIGFVFGVSGYGLAALARMNAISKLFGAPLVRQWIEEI
jgi:hypothetical protein